MPVNSFDDYPMTWRPDRRDLKNPLYCSISETLERDIKEGKLQPGTMLPPQRELADFLDVHLGTITRAFKVCQLKGLIYAVTGKGTFVSQRYASSLKTKVHLRENAQRVDYGGNPLVSKTGQHAIVEMGLMNPFYSLNAVVLEAAKRVLVREDAADLFAYGCPYGSAHQIRAAMAWIERFSLNPLEDEIAIASGAQNALAVVLMACFKPGDKIAVDPYTYPNFIGLANFMNIQLIPVQDDDFGMDPSSLDRICRLQGLKGIYLMPACSNPTNIEMPAFRKKELTDIIKKYHLLLIEDDIYAFLSLQDYQPMTSKLPEQSIYICGTSKSLCAGLRVAYIVFPKKKRAQLISGLYNTNLNTPLLNVEILTELINSGCADNIMAERLALAKERNEIYARYFKPSGKSRNKTSFFQWIPLNGNMSGEHFELLAKEAGVQVFCSERFATGETTDTSFIRLSICSPETKKELERGLAILKALMENGYDRNKVSPFIV